MTIYNLCYIVSLFAVPFRSFHADVVCLFATAIVDAAANGSVISWEIDFPLFAVFADDIEKFSARQFHFCTLYIHEQMGNLLLLWVNVKNLLPQQMRRRRRGRRPRFIIGNMIYVSNLPNRIEYRFFSRIPLTLPLYYKPLERTHTLSHTIETCTIIHSLLTHMAIQRKSVFFETN